MQPGFANFKELLSREQGRALVNELEKLAAYVGTGGTVTRSY